MSERIYKVICFKLLEQKLRSFRLSVLKPVREEEISVRRKINLNSLNIERMKKFSKSFEECDYFLIQDLNGKEEVFFVSGNKGNNFKTLFPKPSALKAAYLLRYQENLEREENVIFSKALISEELPVKKGIYIYEGKGVIEDKGIVGVKLLTSDGLRLLLKEELTQEASKRRAPKEKRKVEGKRYLT